jgi:hypothetical protein
VITAIFNVGPIATQIDPPPQNFACAIVVHCLAATQADNALQDPEHRNAADRGHCRLAP